jgi:hypothetical protein
MKYTRNPIQISIDKLKMEQSNLSDVINLQDNNGISLLEKSLICKKFDIALMILQKGPMLNVVSKDNCNELHYLAASLNDKESIEIAQQLVEAGVNLNLPDKKYKNTPFWYICQKAIQKGGEDFDELIKMCMEKQPDIDCANVAGNTIKGLVKERGNEVIRENVLKEK